MAHSQPSFHFADVRGLSVHLCGCVCDYASECGSVCFLDQGLTTQGMMSKAGLWSVKTLPNSLSSYHGDSAANS